MPINCRPAIGRVFQVAVFHLDSWRKHKYPGKINEICESGMQNAQLDQSDLRMALGIKSQKIPKVTRGTWMSRSTRRVPLTCVYKCKCVCKMSVRRCDECVNGACVFSVCSFLWWMLLVVVCRDQHTVCIPQWINGGWECSNRASGSIHQTDRRCWDRNTPRVFLLDSWIFASLVLCHLCIYVRLDFRHQCKYVCFRVCITCPDSVETNKSKAPPPPPTSPNAHFPSSAPCRQRRQIITSLFFCLLSLHSSYSIHPKCCCGGMWD